MKKFINFIILFLSNLTFTNYFFIKFEQSDFSIAISGLNNFAEDLSDIGFPITFEVSYTFFAVIIALITSLFIYLTILKIDIFENPINLIKVFIKLFFVNFSVLSIILYIFRFYNFPRSYILLDVFIYPIVFILLLILIQIDLSRFVKGRVKYLFPVTTLFVILFFIYSLSNQLSNPSLKTEVNNLEENSNENEIAIEIPLSSLDNVDCYKWAGSPNFENCKKATSLTKIKEYSGNQVNNFVIFNSELYTVLKLGKVIKNNEEFLDISERVFSDASEAGLYDISFHPSEKYFLLSYSNKLNDLVVEKFQFNLDGEIIANQTIFSKPSETYSHYCGSLMWSKHFNSFLLCVGDMGDENLSISTTSQNGKILILNESIVFNPPMISDSAEKIPITNFLAYGLRNPWNFIEHEDLLIILDVGNKTNEELNIIDINELSSNLTPKLFGWPIYEGSVLSEKSFYGLKMWKNPEQDIYDYVKDNSIKPKVYYEHSAPENYRAAMVGTLIFNNPDSFYHNHIIFADYLSKEIFSYDYKEDKLYIINLPYFPGYLTAIESHPSDNNKILFATNAEDGVSEVYELELP